MLVIITLNTSTTENEKNAANCLTKTRAEYIIKVVWLNEKEIKNVKSLIRIQVLFLVKTTLRMMGSKIT